MATIDVVRDIVTKSKIWEGEGSKQRAFKLTDATFTVTPKQVADLETLGRALIFVLSGSSKVAYMAADQHLPRGRTWRQVKDALFKGEVSTRRQLRGVRPFDQPFIFRVDLVLDRSGSFRLIEIEGDKSHGMGYATLSHHIAQTIAPSATHFPGVVEALAAEVQRRWLDRQSKGIPQQQLTTVEPWCDRFYRAATAILVEALAQRNIPVTRIMDETEQSLPEHPLLVSLPPMFDTRDTPTNLGLEREIIGRYLSGDLSTLIPPKPYLGCKSLMGLLSNAGNDKMVESILHTVMPDVGPLETLRSFLPKTQIIDKSTVLSPDQRWVVKVANSSGAHGVFFSGDPDFDAMLARSKGSKAYAVAQEVVETQPRCFPVFDQDGTHLGDELREMRIAVFYTRHGIADIAVTACKEAPVHGGIDAIMMGTTIAS